MEYILIALITFAGLYYLWNGAIPLPTHKAAIEIIVQLAEIKPGLRIAELGSGDGRIVKALAMRGSFVDGYEINPLLSWWSQYLLRKHTNVKIYTKSFWSADLSEYDVVVIFGMTHIMDRLRIKLEKEMRPGTVIISNIFKIPGWQEEVVHGGVRRYRR